MKRFIYLDEKDNVATAIAKHAKNEVAKVYSVNNQLVEEIECTCEIWAYNKIATKDISEGDDIYKYGQIIGRAIKPIKKGELVHVHNVTSLTVNYPKEINDDIIRQMEIEV